MWRRWKVLGAVCTRAYAAPARRFYKEVSVISCSTTDNQKLASENFEICLDNRKLKTPKGTIVSLPNEQLAMAICVEWDAEKEFINLERMHLTRLCFSAIDHPWSKEVLTEEILKYLDTDTIFYGADEDQPSLKELQEQHWKKWISWIEQRFDLKKLFVQKRFDVDSGRHGPGINAFQIPELDPQAKETLRRYVDAYSSWSLTGVHYAVQALKSFILSVALLEHKLSVAEAVKIANVEQEFQTQHWGRVEWAHDIEHYDSCARVAAGILFAQLCATSKTTTRKL